MATVSPRHSRWHSGPTLVASNAVAKIVDIPSRTASSTSSPTGSAGYVSPMTTIGQMIALVGDSAAVCRKVSSNQHAPGSRDHKLADSLLQAYAAVTPSQAGIAPDAVMTNPPSDRRNLADPYRD